MNIKSFSTSLEAGKKDEVWKPKWQRDHGEENRRLKQMYAELSLTHKIMKDVIEKTVKPDAKRKLVTIRKMFIGFDSVRYQ
jgi:hypothetical protein